MGSIIIIIGFSPLSPEHAAGTLYLRTMAPGALPLAGSAISTGALEGLGVMGRALGVTLASVLVNFILDPFDHSSRCLRPTQNALAPGRRTRSARGAGLGGQAAQPPGGPPLFPPRT